MNASDLVARLAKEGIDPLLLAEVAQELFAGEIERNALAERRKHERERKARSRDITGHNVTERDSAGQAGTPSKVSPQTPLPNSPDNAPLNPPRRGKHLLPDDWTMPPIAELTPKAKECAAQWPKGTYEREGEAFECYWRSSNRMMSDWRLTFCNRVIDQHPRIMREAKFDQGVKAEPSFLDHYRAEQQRKQQQNQPHNQTATG